MMKDLEKLMSKKGEGKLSEQEMQAKMDVLQELLQMAQDALGAKVKGGMDEMKKVSVMAPDQESLQKGLEMAQEIAPAIEEEASEEEPTEEPSAEIPAMEVEAKPEEQPEEEDESLFGKRSGDRKKISHMMMDEE